MKFILTYYPVHDSYIHLTTFDYSQLQQRLSGDTTVSQLMIQEFIHGTGARINALPKHARNHQLDCLATHAHAIKGAAGCISALALQKMAEDLEATIRRHANIHHATHLSDVIHFHYTHELYHRLLIHIAS